MITLDASVVIAHLSQQDPHHLAASAYLDESAAEDFLMHSLNLAEVLVGGARAGRAEEMLDDLHSIGIRVAERPDTEALRLANLRASSGLKLPDCCALDTALVTGSTLATFDQQLAEAARGRHVTVAPLVAAAARGDGSCGQARSAGRSGRQPGRSAGGAHHPGS